MRKSKDNNICVFRKIDDPKRGRVNGKGASNKPFEKASLLKEPILKLLCILDMQYDLHNAKVALEADRALIDVDLCDNCKLQELEQIHKNMKRVKYLERFLENEKKNAMLELKQTSDSLFTYFEEDSIIFKMSFDAIYDKENDIIQPIPRFLDPLAIEKQVNFGDFTSIYSMLMQIDDICRRPDRGNIEQAVKEESGYF